MLIRLTHDSPGAKNGILALRAIYISNDLYGSNTMNLFEIEKGYKKPIIKKYNPVVISTDLVNARDTLFAKAQSNHEIEIYSIPYHKIWLPCPGICIELPRKMLQMAVKACSKRG